MKMMMLIGRARGVAAVAFFSLSLISASSVNQSGRADCCRSLESPIHYDSLPSDIFPEHDAEIIRLKITPESKELTIRHPSGPLEEYIGFLTYKQMTTRDDGKTWTGRPVTVEMSSPLATRLNDSVQAPSNENFVYRYVQELGLYLVSEDGGRRWRLPAFRVEGLARSEFASKIGGNDFYTTQFHLAAVHPHDPKTVYATISVVPWATLIYSKGDLGFHDLDGLFISRDGGESWNHFAQGILNYSPLGVSPSSEQIMFAQDSHGVVKSTDGGKTWRPVGKQSEMASAPLMQTDGTTVAREEDFKFLVKQFLIDPSDDGIVYVVSNKGIYRSTDGGDSWCLLNLGFDILDGVHSMAINARESREIFVGSSQGVFQSKDRGCHFRQIYP